MASITDWNALVARFGPIVAAAAVPGASLERAACDGRLFRLVVQRDGYGSGDVSIEVLTRAPLSTAFGVSGSVAWAYYCFSAAGVIDGLADAACYGWETFTDVPGLPGDGSAPRNEPVATLATLLREADIPEWACVLAALDRDVYLRMFVAGYDGSPSRALRLLARDPDEDVRLALARHRNTPTEALEILAHGTDLSATRAVGENPSTPPGLLAFLATHAVDSVRFGVARNPSTPAALLARLLQDPSPVVRAVAKR